MNNNTSKTSNISSIDILRQYLDQYFPNLNILIVSSDGINGQLLFKDKFICYFKINDISSEIAEINNDLYFCNCNLCFCVFRIIFHHINQHKKISSYDLQYINYLTDEQLLRYMNLILILSEDTEYTEYRKIDDPQYIRSIIYLNALV